MDSTQYRSRWPKPLPVLTEEQRRIREDFMEHWQEVRPNRFGLVERFNQRYPHWVDIGETNVIQRSLIPVPA